MTEVNGLGEIPTGNQQQASGMGDLDSEAFLQLLVAQMRYQDPMSPTDHTTMLQQTSQFTQVEALQKVTELQQQLLGLTQAHMATGLLGQEVAAEDADGDEVSGVVQAIRFTGDGPLLDLGGEQVPLPSATEVSLPSASATFAATDAGEAQDVWSGPWSHDAEDTNS